MFYTLKTSDTSHTLLPAGLSEYFLFFTHFILTSRQLA